MFEFIIYLKVIKNDIFLDNTLKEAIDVYIIIIKFNIVIITKASIAIILIFIAIILIFYLI